MLLNWVARASSSSPVRTSMRSPRLPAPILAAPACSVRIGRTIARASIKLPTTERAMPRMSRSTVRWIEA